MKKLLVGASTCLFSSLHHTPTNHDNLIGTDFFIRLIHVPISSPKYKRPTTVIQSSKLFLANHKRASRPPIQRKMFHCFSIRQHLSNLLLSPLLFNPTVDCACPSVFTALASWHRRARLITCKSLRAFSKINGSWSTRFWVWQESSPFIFDSPFGKSNSSVTRSFSTRIRHSKSLISLSCFF